MEGPVKFDFLINRCTFVNLCRSKKYAVSESGLRHQILSAHGSVNAYLFA